MDKLTSENERLVANTDELRAAHGAEMESMQRQKRACEEELTRLRTREAALEDEVRDLRSRLATAHTEIGELKARLAAAQSEIGDLKARLAVTEAKLQATEVQLRGTDAQLKTTETRLQMIMSTQTIPIHLGEIGRRLCTALKTRFGAVHPTKAQVIRACAPGEAADSDARRIRELLPAVAAEHGLETGVVRRLVFLANGRNHAAHPSRDEVVRLLRDMRARGAPEGMGWVGVHAEALERCALRLLPPPPPDESWDD